MSAVPVPAPHAGCEDVKEAVPRSWCCATQVMAPRSNHGGRSWAWAMIFAFSYVAWNSDRGTIDQLPEPSSARQLGQVSSHASRRRGSLEGGSSGAHVTSRGQKCQHWKEKHIITHRAARFGNQRRAHSAMTTDRSSSPGRQPASAACSPPHFETPPAAGPWRRRHCSPPSNTRLIATPGDAPQQRRRERRGHYARWGNHNQHDRHQIPAAGTAPGRVDSHRTTPNASTDITSTTAVRGTVTTRSDSVNVAIPKCQIRGFAQRSAAGRTPATSSPGHGKFHQATAGRKAATTPGPAQGTRQDRCPAATRPCLLRHSTAGIHEAHGTRVSESRGPGAAVELPLQGVRKFVVEWSRR